MYTNQMMLNDGLLSELLTTINTYRQKISKLIVWIFVEPFYSMYINYYTRDIKTSSNMFGFVEKNSWTQ